MKMSYDDKEKEEEQIMFKVRFTTPNRREIAQSTTTYLMAGWVNIRRRVEVRHEISQDGVVSS